jgi:hypothetical protein
MSDGYRDLHKDAYKEWKQHQTDEYIQAQRRAFLDGFETAANESKQFRLLREWLEEERDKAKQKHEERDGDGRYLARYLAFTDTLVKLHKMGCTPEKVGEN